MNRISIYLLLMVAFAVALVVGFLVVAPPGVVENPPTRVVLPVGIEY